MGLGFLAGGLVQAAGSRKIDGILCELTSGTIVVMVRATKIPTALTAETKYRKGKAEVVPTDIKISQRVIVTVVDEEGVATATEVRV